MSLQSLIGHALSIQKPCYIKEVRYDINTNLFDIFIDFRDEIPLAQLKNEITRLTNPPIFHSRETA